MLFSHPVMSDSLWPRGLQHARPPCPSPSPGVCPSSCSLLRWYHPVISPSDTLSSFCPQSFPESRTFPMICLFTPDDLNTGVSASASVLPVNIQGWSSLSIDWFDLLAIQGTFRSLLQHHSSKASILWCSIFFTIQLSQPYMTTGKSIALTFFSRIMSLLISTLSKFIIAFMSRSSLLILGLQSPSTVIWLDLIYWSSLLLLLLSHFSRVRLCDPINGSLPGSPVRMV